MFNVIVFFFRRLLAIPIGLVMSPVSFISDNMREGGSRALMFGLPAVLVAVFGVSAVCWAEFFSRDNLEDKYSALAEACTEDKIKLLAEINNERRLMEATGQGESVVDSLDPDDERRDVLTELQKAEQIYLEKLIALNPDNQDYRFRLAIVSLQRGDATRCRSLMESIAPVDEPGNPEAHLWRAQDLLNTPASNQVQLQRNFQDALKHVDHCLVRDSGNVEARWIKARLLTAQRRLRDAYVEFDILFETYPRFYRQMIDINDQLGREADNAKIIEDAQRKFEAAVAESKADGDDNTYSQIWRDLISCLHYREDYEGAAEQLIREEEAQGRLASTAESREEETRHSSRHVFIKQLLTQTYTIWADSLGTAGEIDLETERQQLELLKKALGYNMHYADALKLVARITVGDSELAEDARQIYDPEKDQGQAPAVVLNEMGSRALQNEEYNKAIKYFEWAKDKSPNNPMILNNLAWTYLVCENQKPDRALGLVNDAIRALQRMQDVEQRRTLASHFFDTRGRALLQMGRKIEASASF
ncbi:MAG: hypothetical protein AAF456_24870, partial [Planctomycetota bacterium]